MCQRLDIVFRNPNMEDADVIVPFFTHILETELIENHLDHYLLNDVEGLENPTSEQISIWLWNRIKPHLSDLAEIVVHETCTARCIYRGPGEG